LLVRLDGLGDALACVPSLEGLRRALPGAHFDAVCSAKNASLFNPERVERVYEFPAADGTDGLIAQLRDRRYTACMVATEEPIGYRLAGASGAPRRAGFWHRFEKPFKSWWQFAQLTDRVYRPAAWIADPVHEVVALYGLAECIGAHAPAPDDAASLRSWLAVDRTGADETRALTLALQMNQKWTSGDWGPAAIGAFAAAVFAASRFAHLVMLASSHDEGLARAVLEHMVRGAASAGRITLRAALPMQRWLGEIARADAIVTPDTGAAHAAGMLGVPVVDLFDATRYDQLSRRWRPWAAPSRCLIKPAYRAGIEDAFANEVAAALADIAPLSRNA